MTGTRKPLAFVSLTLLQFAVFTQASAHCPEVKTKPNTVKYARLGETVVLNVTFAKRKSIAPYQAYWKKDCYPLAIKNENGNTSHYDCPISQTIAIIGKASLEIRNMTLEHIGTYTLMIYCKANENYEHPPLEVTVNVIPIVSSNCSNMTVNDSDDITCLCRTATKGNLPVEVSWIWTTKSGETVRYLNDTLKLEKLSGRQNGTYTCLANRSSLINKISFTINVLYKRLEIKSFKAFQEVGNHNGQLMIICNAHGIPAPTYTIEYNGNKVTSRNILKVNLDDKKASSGLYECIASNRYESRRRSLPLSSSILLWKKTDSWYVSYRIVWFTVGAVCSFVLGIIFLYAIRRCCEKFKNRTVNEDYVDVAPTKSNEIQPRRKSEQELINEYQNFELRARKVEVEAINDYEDIEERPRKVEVVNEYQNIEVRPVAGRREIQRYF